MGSDKNGYSEIVNFFATYGNKVNDYDIEKVEISPYAFRKTILDQIQGETTMALTGFVVRMKDDKCFGFGTSYYQIR